jgi:benzylsuccinate CoA-transferase BbsF subunit
MLSLEGYRILDLGTAWAAPMLTQLLADMGCEVIKVESKSRLDGLRLGRPIVGDDIAGGDEGKWPNLQPAFHALNRNKLGITLDIKQSEGLALFKRLVKISDVVCSNFSPGVMERLGLGYESLKEVKPDIVAIFLSGVGQYGPYRDATLYATSITALSGVSSLIGYHNELPLGMTALAYGDANASNHGAFVVLAALYHRSRTGEGQQIDLAEAPASTSILGEAIMDHIMNGRAQVPQGNRHTFMAPHNNYRCNGDDKWVSIAIKTDAEWHSFCQAVGDLPWTINERFADGLGRYKYQEELDKCITNWTGQFTPYEVMAKLQQFGVAAIPVMNIEDQYCDPHYQERNTFIEVEHPLVGLETLYGIPWRLSETPGEIRRVAPSLGEHNSYVYGELLGLATEEVARLSEQKVIY